MAEGRFVSKAISADYKLNCVVSFESDYLYTRCIPHLDRDGRMTGHPAEVKAIAVPLRAEMTLEVIDRCLAELAEAKLVLWYEVDGKACLWFKGFKKHQTGLRYDREGESKLPDHDGPKVQAIASVLRTNSGALRSSSGELGSLPAEGKGREVKGSEVKKLRRAENVENSGKPAYNRRELLEAARRTCGLGRWSADVERRAQSIIRAWEREGRRSEDVWAAIHGSRLLVDGDEVNWRSGGKRTLLPGQPFGLQALRNTRALYDQQDGRAPRPLFDCSIERYHQYEPTGPPVLLVSSGPGRVVINPNPRFYGSDT